MKVMIDVIGQGSVVGYALRIPRDCSVRKPMGPVGNWCLIERVRGQGVVHPICVRNI